MRRGNALIIDDEPDVATYQARILSDHGWRVRIASNGDQGLALALEEAPDVILLDLMMPGGRGGLNTFMELRKTPRLASIPVVFVTAYPEPDPDDLYNFLGRQKRLRPDAYLEKPVDPETLMATLENLTGALDQPPNNRP
jgi:twitching motility two-component system response regulator PilH